MTTKKNIVLILISLFTLATHAQSSQAAPTWIESLEIGDSYDIEITSIGCFGGSRQNVTFIKEGDTISAQLQDKIIQLNEADYQTIIAFENELRNMSMGGCTTVDTYVLSFNGQKFQTSDGTCSWHGYRKVMALFD